VPGSPNINNQFFNGVYQDVWRKLVPEGLTEAEVDFIEEIGRLKQGSRVLDLMCGYGRHSLELGKRGYDVTAIDNLADYIEEIEYRKGDLSIATHKSSLTEMKLNSNYDAIICMGNSFCFFNREEATAIISHISKHLEAGGIFIINTWTLAEIAIKYFKEKDWFYAGDVKYLVDNRYLLNPARIESDHIIVESNGKTEVIKGVDYIFTISELDQMLGEGGLEIKEIYSTPRKRPFRFGDTRAYVVAGQKSAS
jgi:SAM-dependent methyltransferase